MRKPSEKAARAKLNLALKMGIAESQVLFGNATNLPLPDESVDCIVTSPPYNCGMDYDGVSDSWGSGDDYGVFAFAACREMARVLKPGGRVWLNCLHVLPIYDDIEALRRDRGTGRKGAKMLDERWSPFDYWQSGLGQVAGLSYRDTITWVQTGGHDQSTAWGSVLSPNAPNLRGRWEPIGLYFKDTWDRGRVEKNDLTWDEFSRWTRNVWEIKPASAVRAKHPAPFPSEIPLRAIKLSTWPGDVVLDPFCGSGTTVRVAKDLGRVGIGFDLSEKYVEMANNRLGQEVLAV